MKHSGLFVLRNAKGNMLSYTPKDGTYKVIPKNRYILLKVWDCGRSEDLPRWFASQPPPQEFYDWKEIPKRIVRKFKLV